MNRHTIDDRLLVHASIPAIADAALYGICPICKTPRTMRRETSGTVTTMRLVYPCGHYDRAQELAEGTDFDLEASS